MIRCHIQAGALYYTGIFPSAIAALLDAMDRVPPGTPISARPIHA